MQKDLKLILIGFIQLLFLSANTFFIAHKNYSMIAISCFLTNIVFSYSVKVLAFSGMRQRVAFSIGCTIGCVAGTLAASFILGN